MNYESIRKLIPRKRNVFPALGGAGILESSYPSVCLFVLFVNATPLCLSPHSLFNYPGCTTVSDALTIHAMFSVLPTPDHRLTTIYMLSLLTVGPQTHLNYFLLMSSGELMAKKVIGAKFSWVTWNQMQRASVTSGVQEPVLGPLVGQGTKPQWYPGGKGQH